ncbi:SubName: Full=Uncharacterized protein {ECO:0000313/EMBL:CCA75888.1} [Serendipita indica DSM 11827]|uniref:Small ribosomal subunit protein mS41 n=1 Tax=Serendipita indica (strain DSM 11827) TaxID=1109443 RepID=G4TX45_SERID|nr:SubName: Full=Uncharacterized protein {ECO:0000313/EMBL:CCA75888.1} [Serendipita indica DSM 11827]CAG7855287.1 SubName: Full=Uncharacterized protein {ECO:0000313/EMBL:CCA75888.1} [Serendipita indica DSM 11827]CAG7855297.1 SubName: Full=Uncharacterized protein {ECO:0000313/EMBL:CCA75888.1} [Serendipita indica DSM 11827]CCA75888.1 hypothetical protein PIIN_09884 [Serendipita indica DSM 11827]
MSFVAQFHARRLVIRGVLRAPGRLYAADSTKQGSTGGFEPAAAVPNTPSPFQMTPEMIRQQKKSEEATRVPLDKRGYDTKSLLVAFGRKCETKLPDVDTLSWEELFRLNGQKLDKMGLTVQERRYLLWCLEKFRQGEDPKVYAREPQPKKTQRGWGPPIRKKTVPIKP